MTGIPDLQKDSRFPLMDNLYAVQQKEPACYDTLSPQQQKRLSGSSASKANRQGNNDDDGHALSDTASASVSRRTDAFAPFGEQGVLDGGMKHCSVGGEHGKSPAAKSASSCSQNKLDAGSSSVVPSAHLGAQPTPVAADEGAWQQMGLSGSNRSCSSAEATRILAADSCSLSISAGSSERSVDGKTRSTKKAPSDLVHPPTVSGSDSIGGRSIPISDAYAPEDDAIDDDRLPAVGSSGAAEEQVLVCFTDVNIEPQLQKLKCTLDYLLAEKDLLSEANKYERHFAMIANSMGKEINATMQHRVRTAKMLLDGGLCQLVVSYWRALDMKNQKGWYQKKGNRMTGLISFYRLIVVVAQSTDLRSAEILATVARDLLDFIMSALDSDALSVPTKVRLHSMVVKGMLSVLYNVVRRCDGGVDAVRSRDGVRIVGKHVAHGKQETHGKHATKAKAIFVLGQIISEDEQKHLLAVTDSNMEYLVMVLKDCVAAGHATGYRSATYGYSADDLLEGLTRMAAALDSNKLRIVRAGALPLYVTLMGDRCSREQQTAACRGVWTLAFCKENRELFLKDPSCMEALRHLTTSPDSHVSKAARGALWIIEDEEKRVRDLSLVTRSSEVQGGQHIMMSYNWSVQEEVFKVRDRLKATGFNIWIDVEKMSGSTLEAMAKSIEDAAVVLIFFNEKYKHSAACRSEAEYTYKLGKQFIPIRMQHKYSPDGWLGMLLGTKFFFDLSKVDRWEHTVQAILKELGDSGKTPTASSSTQDECSAAGVHISKRNVSERNDDRLEVKNNESLLKGEPRIHVAELSLLATAAYGSNSMVEGWTQEQIQTWLHKNHLQTYAERFADFSGRHLLELRRMLTEAPAYCYAALEHQLGLKLPHLLSFTIALRELER